MSLKKTQINAQVVILCDHFLITPCLS
uniref:Uncharacterized protein n=1 Tax=Anguilla anguilla TaxID=7936 RepID=A0A0E9PMC8_ANGAN